MGKLDRWLTSRIAPVLAALLVLVASLPGLIALPVLDRDEARAAQAAVQMQEDGDYTAIRFQSRLRGGAAPGAPWLQALSVKAFSNVEARAIQAYRLPSLLGMMLAASACVWGAAGLFGRLAGGVSGLMFAGSLFAALGGATAGADGLFIGACALALSAFARIYIGMGGARTRALFWTGIILGVLVKGPLIIAFALAAGVVLFAFDRKAPWLKSLGWGWGVIALVAITGPWIVAVTIATDGAFWSQASAFGEGAALGVQTLAAPLLLFPAAAFLPLGAAYAWRHKDQAGVRLAVAWAGPAWLWFELSPDKQAHDAAPLYISLIWLAAAAFTSSAWRPGLWTRRISVGVSAVCGAVLAGLVVVIAARFGAGGDVALSVAIALLFLCAAGAAAMSVTAESRAAALAACALAVAASGLTFGVLAPGIERLWPTREVLAALERTGLDPRRGLAIGPVTSTGHAEPSLVFALGAATETGDAAGAAAAIDEGRPAIVEAREDAAFRAAARGLGVTPRPVATVEGFDYVQARDVRITIYAPPPKAPRR